MEGGNDRRDSGPQKECNMDLVRFTIWEETHKLQFANGHIVLNTIQMDQYNGSRLV